MTKDWKDKLALVYSTNPDFKINSNPEKEISLSPGKQILKIFLDRKQRKGKTVTIVQNFIGSQKEIDELSKWLKIKCGTGGSTKNGEIIIQGDFCDKILNLLIEAGYKIKK